MTLSESIESKFLGEQIPATTCRRLAGYGSTLAIFCSDLNLTYINTLYTATGFGSHGRIYLMLPRELTVMHTSVKIEVSARGRSLLDYEFPQMDATPEEYQKFQDTVETMVLSHKRRNANQNAVVIETANYTINGATQYIPPCHS
jgi:hypothetical protein